MKTRNEAAEPTTTVFDIQVLKDAERFIRFAMAVTLVTAGVSKLFSHGGFAAYYSGLFKNPELRINLPPLLVDAFLNTTPFIEIGLGLGLLYTPLRRFFVKAWCLFFVAIEFGHYILQEWATVNQIIPFFTLGAICMILPNHRSWFARDSSGTGSPVSGEQETQSQASKASVAARTAP